MAKAINVSAQRQRVVASHQFGFNQSALNSIPDIAGLKK